MPVAVPPELDRDGTPDGVTRADGTSFAAPIVSGVASWLMRARPGLSAGQYADLLRGAAKDVGDPGWDAGTGFGMVDLAAALKAKAPAADRAEPDDGIAYVDGTVFDKPDPYIWTGGAPRTVRASVTPSRTPSTSTGSASASHQRHIRLTRQLVLLSLRVPGSGTSPSLPGHVVARQPGGLAPFAHEPSERLQLAERDRAIVVPRFGAIAAGADEMKSPKRPGPWSCSRARSARDPDGRHGLRMPV